MLLQVDFALQNHFPQIKEQFSGFSQNAGKLPFCCFRIHERKEDLTEGKQLIKTVGMFSFYRGENGILIESEGTYAALSDDFSAIDVYVSAEKPPSGMHTAFLMLQGYRFLAAHAEQFQMHSAVVVHNGCGIAFCGVPGAGKSTQAHLWERYVGAQGLNYDQPLVLFDGDAVLVSGSPWSGKEPCYKNTAAELKAIFFVEQAQENTAVRMTAAEAFSLLYLNNYLLPINDEIAQKHQRAILRVIGTVPVYRLKCTISEQAVDAAYRAVFGKSFEKGAES